MIIKQYIQSRQSIEKNIDMLIRDMVIIKENLNNKEFERLLEEHHKKLENLHSQVEKVLFKDNWCLVNSDVQLQSSNELESPIMEIQPKYQSS